MLEKKAISLREYNTFGVDVSTDFFYQLDTLEDVKILFNKGIFKTNFLIIGEGSNILFTKDFHGSVIKINIQGRQILTEDSKEVRLKIGSGEILDEIVKWSVENNWIGIQNLALIPGTIGATPVQNVGAYGVEIKDVLESVEYLDLISGEIEEIKTKNCNFGYRDSIFKHELRNQSLILSITIKLYKDNTIDQKYLAYGDITKELEANYHQPYKIKDLYNAISTIRKNKLPDVKEYGSCGSTFQNPMITLKEYKRIKKNFPELPSFTTDNKDYVKIPAAYILERIGWKDRRVGKGGTWTHPLIVTNYGGADGKELLNIIKEIQEDFYKATRVHLEPEINII